MCYEDGIRHKEQGAPNLAVWEFLHENRPELRENCLKELIEIAKKSPGLDNLKGKDYIDFCIEAVLKANISDNLKQEALNNIANHSNEIRGSDAYYTIASKLQDPNEAIDYFVRGFNVNPNDNCYRKIKNLASQNDRALEALKTIANNNNNPDYTYDLGLVYKNRNLHVEAIDCFMSICNLSFVHWNPSQLHNLGILYEQYNCINEAINIYSQLYSILHFNSKSTGEISEYTYGALVKYAKTGMSEAIKVLETISNKGDIPTTEILCKIYTDTDQSVKVLRDAFNYENDDESSRTRILLHLKELADNGNVTAKNILNEVAQRNEIVAFLIE